MGVFASLPIARSETSAPAASTAAATAATATALILLLLLLLLCNCYKAPVCNCCFFFCFLPIAFMHFFSPEVNLSEGFFILVP